MKIFNGRNLAYFNGKDGRPAYIAFGGRVYDVSHSFLWKDGEHQVLHEAGRDLTAEINSAPHGAELLARVRQIGILKRNQ